MIPELPIVTDMDKNKSPNDVGGLVAYSDWETGWKNGWKGGHLRSPWPLYRETCGPGEVGSYFNHIDIFSSTMMMVNGLVETSISSKDERVGQTFTKVISPLSTPIDGIEHLQEDRMLFWCWDFYPLIKEKETVRKCSLTPLCEPLSDPL